MNAPRRRAALAHAYLCSDLTADELAPAEGLMLKLLDDPSPLVRRALADALAASPAAPAPVIIALASDQPQIAAPIYQRGSSRNCQPRRAAVRGRCCACRTRQRRGLSDFGGK
jgi:uncharacterized protein (DUF2336 family)